MNYRRLTHFLSLLLVAYFFVYAPAASAQVPTPTTGCAAGINKCDVCASDTTDFPQFASFNVGSSGKSLGEVMIGQIFTIVNGILNKIESTYFTNVINNPQFQQIIGVCFILYILLYGLMIIFNLASYKSGEITSRLFKIAIVYCMCTSGGWTFFNTWIQTPVIGSINNLITNIADAGSGGGSGGNCVTAGQFSGNPVATSGTTDSGFTLSLSNGPMAMLWGPMSCVFGARFMAGVVALIKTGFYGWVLAMLLIYGMVEFMFMVLGAIATYVKAIVGLTFLFAIAPIFFSFYLFEKTRSLTMGWMSTVISFALQPVILFAFLAFYAGIVGNAVSNIFTDSAGNQEDLCYVPTSTMPGLVTMYFWSFTNPYHVAGGHWVDAKGSGVEGGVSPPPAQVIQILYFLVLSNLGKQFSNFIDDFAATLSGGTGAGSVTGSQVKQWIDKNIGPGAGTATAAAAFAGTNRGFQGVLGRLLGVGPRTTTAAGAAGTAGTTIRRSMPTGSGN